MKHTKKEMKIIGLTGTVGSGKTTVAHILEKEFGAKLLIMDEIGHLFMEPDTKGYQQILEVFGEDILEENLEKSSTENGKEKRKIDRKRLGEKVFGKKEQIEKLNKIIHPLVNQYVLDCIQKEREKGEFSYLVIESALLIEAGYHRICDELWFITVDDEIRRERLKMSRNYSDEKITAILKNQLSEEDFQKNCKKVLKNNGNLTEILQEIKVLLELQ